MMSILRSMRSCAAWAGWTALVLSAMPALSEPLPLNEMGFLDVTSAPFATDPTGATDSTTSLQRAIDCARNHCMVAYFPPGRYLVSDTLLCEQGKQGRRERVQDAHLLAMGFGIGPRALPCVLMGSTRGRERPRIVLRPHSAGFDDPTKRKYVVRFVRWDKDRPNHPQPNGSFNQMFVGIDIEIGEGNPGAVGIRHRGAQGSGVQDCTIDATHGYSGIEGGCGSGGGHVHVTVIGGRVGADLLEAQPAPTITGFTLIGQTECALRYAGYETLTAVGLRIVSDAPGPVIRTRANRQSRDLFGQLTIVDGSIEFRHPTEAAAIQTQTSLHLRNVYFRNAKTLVEHTEGGRLATDAEGWGRVREYAHGIDPHVPRLERDYQCPVYVDGVRSQSRTLAAVLERAAPPGDLRSRHLWSSPFPSHESPGAVNVRQAPYLAQGDGRSDDTAALQRAVDENEIVFLPRGKYGISRTLRLRPNTKLVGAHRVFTIITALPVEGGDFANPDQPNPLIRTADDSEADTAVAFLGLAAGAPGAYALDWRAGRNSVYRAVELWSSCPHPQVVVSGHGGGRWYNFHSDHRGSPHPDYRHLLVSGATEPLAFYQCNPEHGRGEANMEIHGARHVRIYGLKGESPTPILLIRDSDDVFVSGYGGNAVPPPGKSLVLVERTPNFVIANLVDRPMGVRGEPASWHALIERTADGQTIATLPLDRPVVYQRGRITERP